MEKTRRVVERLSPEEKDTLFENFAHVLTQGKFISIATCNHERMPSVAPKLIVQTHKNIIYLIDYVKGRTYANLKENPRASLAFIDEHSLTGYQLNGPVTILEHGEEFVKLSEEFQKIKTDLTVERIMMDVRAGTKSSVAAAVLPEKFAILKIKIIEIIEIAPSGALKSKLAF